MEEAVYFLPGLAMGLPAGLAIGLAAGFEPGRAIVCAPPFF